MKLIGKALQLCKKNLIQHKEQLASQLWGRIQDFNYSKIKYLLNQIKQIQTPWLCPLKPTLHPPLTRLLGNLEANSDSVEFLAVTPDSKKVISACPGVPNIWDFKTGELLYTLPSHPNPLGVLAVAPNGRQIIFRSIDNFLKVWDLEKETEPFQLEGDTTRAKILLITPDSKRAVYISNNHVSPDGEVLLEAFQTL